MAAQHHSMPVSSRSALPSCSAFLSVFWRAIFGGWVDDAISRVIDSFLSFPAIVLAIAVTGALGIGLTNGMIAVGIVFAPQLARLVRARTLVVRNELYVDSARCFGATTAHILWRHITPNTIQPVIVHVTLLLAAALLAEASLSFLGLGIQPPEASWGSMLARAYQNMEIAPEQMYPPGLAILVISLAFNALGGSRHRRRFRPLRIAELQPETSMPFETTHCLIRGEIAIRIARAAGDGSLATVAIYPSDDALSLHVRAADEALEIPGGARAPTPMSKR